MTLKGLYRQDADFIAESRTLAPKIALALKEAVLAIEREPHAVYCALHEQPLYNCTCWKQTALARINELLK